MPCCWVNTCVWEVGVSAMLSHMQFDIQFRIYPVCPASPLSGTHMLTTAIAIEIAGQLRHTQERHKWHMQSPLSSHQSTVAQHTTHWPLIEEHWRRIIRAPVA